MKKFRVIFFKAPSIGYLFKHPFAGLIAVRTWSMYVHVELQVPHELCEYFRNTDNGLVGYKVDATERFAKGTCYTSTLRDGYNGACKRPASEVMHNPGRWEYKEYTCNNEDYELMIHWLDKQVLENKGYDVKGVVK